MSDVGTIRRDSAPPQPQRPEPSRWRTPVRWFLHVTCLGIGVNGAQDHIRHYQDPPSPTRSWCQALADRPHTFEQDQRCKEFLLADIHRA